MPGREEIREQAIVDLMEYKGFDRVPTEDIVDCVMKSQSNKGVVIKVGTKNILSSEIINLSIVESLLKEPDGNQDKD